MALSLRTRNVRTFIHSRDYDDGAGSTLQIGLTTYRPMDDGDQSYQTSYLEWGGRSDHLDDAIANARGRQVPVRRVSEANDTDRVYVGSNERNGITAASLQTVEADS